MEYLYINIYTLFTHAFTELFSASSVVRLAAYAFIEPGNFFDDGYEEYLVYAIEQTLTKGQRNFVLKVGS